MNTIKSLSKLLIILFLNVACFMLHVTFSYAQQISLSLTPINSELIL